MKTAYEIAMERLNKAMPIRKLTDEQKRLLAELDSRYTARIAEREIALKTEIDKASTQGDFQKVEQLEKQLASERQALQAELEAKKEKIRQAQ
jgi:septin family protein